MHSTGKGQTEEGIGLIVFASIVQQKSLASRELPVADRGGTPTGVRSAEVRVER